MRDRMLNSRVGALDSDALEAALREGAQREIDATQVDLRQRALADIDAQPTRAGDARTTIPIARRLTPFALAASAAIVGGVAIRTAFLASQPSPAKPPDASVAVFLSRSLTAVERMVVEETPQRALDAFDRFVEQPLRERANAALTDARRALGDFGERANPLRDLPPLPQKQ